MAETPPASNGHMRLRPDRFVRDALVILAVLALVILAWHLRVTVLLGLLGVLLGVVLRAGGNGIAKLLGVSHGTGLGILAVLAVMLLGGLGYLVVPRVDEEFGQLAERLPDAIMKLEQQLAEAGLLPTPVMDGGLYQQLQALGEALLSRTGGIISGTLGVLTSLGLVLFVGAYTAVSPGSYRRGFIRLFPLRKRESVGDVLDDLYDTLQKWMLGQLSEMVIVGLLSWIGLLLLGVPLALTFGIIAGLFAFVPVVGPIVSTLAPALLALTIDPWLGIYVVLLFLGIQTVESYLITPMIQKKAVSILPAVLILAQVVMGTVAGAVGIILAAPLMATVLVLVDRLYVRRLEGRPLDDGDENQLRFWS
ncbi:MAG: AI-2E family transporter [Phycisphaerae bacterium]